MSRQTVRNALAALALVLMLGAVGVSPLAAQEATPAPVTSIELAPGVPSPGVGFGSLGPGRGRQFTRPTSSSSPAPKSSRTATREPRPRRGIGHVGLDAAGGDGARDPRGGGRRHRSTEDVTEIGKEITLQPGDAIYYEDDVVHTARGAGDEPTVVYGSFVLTTGEPLLMPTGMDMSGTPAA